MKKVAFMVVCMVMFSSVAHAELTPQDLIDFQTNLSSIISFFAGVLAITGFVMGVMGGRGH